MSLVPTPLSILVVDDEPNMRRVLEIMLARRGHRTVSAADGQEALEQLQEQRFDLVISDMQMPRLNGIDLLRRLRAAGIEVPLIMITAHGSIETAVEAMKLGACDYLLRPFDVETLDLAIGRVFAVNNLLRSNDYLRAAEDKHWQGVIGRSEAMQQLRKQIVQVAPTHASVLLTGETGTGKEVAARAIHRASNRAAQLFVAINCAAIPAEMLESELFGHEKGAFTGALRSRVGKFELASGGTLFLDEITEMPVALQSKLLRVLQEGEVQPLGGNRTLKVDVRVIAASNRDPRQAIRDARLREDLYFRLNVFGIALPPLRQRLDDLPDLAAHFIELHAGNTRRPPTISAQALHQLTCYDWPGNVRELNNMMERALILAEGSTVLEPRHFPIDAIATTPMNAAPAIGSDQSLDDAVEVLEKRMIADALQACANNKVRAAQRLRISERSIWYKIKKYGIGDEGA